MGFQSVPTQLAGYREHLGRPLGEPFCQFQCRVLKRIGSDDAVDHAPLEGGGSKDPLAEQHHLHRSNATGGVR